MALFLSNRKKACTSNNSLGNKNSGSKCSFPLFENFLQSCLQIANNLYEVSLKSKQKNDFHCARFPVPFAEGH